MCLGGGVGGMDGCIKRQLDGLIGLICRKKRFYSISCAGTEFEHIDINKYSPEGNGILDGRVVLTLYNTLSLTSSDA